MEKRLFAIFTIFGVLMRYIFICLLLTSCLCQAQEIEYKVMFDYNSETDISHYNLFITELLDTTLTPFIESGEPDSIRSYQIDSANEIDLKAANVDTGIISFISIANGLYLQAALTAVNMDSFESTTAVSDCYKKANLVKPSKPVILMLSEK